MPEYPIIITRNAAHENIGGDAAASGYEANNAIDNLDYTSYRPSTTGSFFLDYIVNIVNFNSINACAIKFRGQGSFTITIYDSDTGNVLGSKSSCVAGSVYIPLSAGPTKNFVRVAFNDSYSDFELVHFWVGNAYTIKDPIQPFDPNQVLLGQEKFENNNGINIKNSVKFRKKILQGTWTNVSGTVKTNFEYLREHSFKNGTPFWFFMRPTTSPTDGDLYHFDMDEFKLDYNVGIQRTVSVKAIAEYVIDPENTPIAQPTSFTKSFSNMTWTHAVPQPDAYIVLRKVTPTDTGAIVDAPTSGRAYYIGETIGASTVIYIGNSNSCDANLSVGVNYWKIFSVNGVETGDYKYLTSSPPSYGPFFV